MTAKQRSRALMKFGARPARVLVLHVLPFITRSARPLAALLWFLPKLGGRSPNFCLPAAATLPPTALHRMAQRSL